MQVNCPLRIFSDTFTERGLCNEAKDLIEWRPSRIRSSEFRTPDSLIFVETRNEQQI